MGAAVMLTQVSTALPGARSNRLSHPARKGTSPSMVCASSLAQLQYRDRGEPGDQWGVQRFQRGQPAGPS